MTERLDRCAHIYNETGKKNKVDLRINEGLNGLGVTVVAPITPVTVERNDEACHHPILLLPGPGVIQHRHCMGLQKVAELFEYCAMHMATL